MTEGQTTLLGTTTSWDPEVGSHTLFRVDGKNGTVFRIESNFGEFGDDREEYGDEDSVQSEWSRIVRDVENSYKEFE